MNFGNQTILYGLFALPLVVIFYLYVFRRKKMLLLRLGSWELIRRLLPAVSRTRQILKAGMLILAVALLVFSLSRPQYGSIERPITRKGVDIFIAIDTSLSMLAQDIQPSRLARAEEQLNGLIHRLRGDRVGIITFAGTAFVQCPLTLDYALAQNILETIDADSVPIAGTAIGMAIRTATNAFERSARGEKVLVLLTDGEDHETDPLGAAQAAAKAGVKIYSIGIGSEKGEPIRLPDGSFKKDSDGHVVNSRLDLVLLQKIAQATGGKTIKANPKGGLELDVLYADIGLIQKKTLRSQTYTIYEERFQYFLLPVILLLIMEMLTGDRKKAAVRKITLMLLLPLIFGFTLTDSLSRLTRLGNHAFEEGKLEQALEIYKNAQVESPESPELHFNIGNVLLKNKKYEDAIKEFEQAAALLKEPSRMADAQYNIGVAQYRMAEQLIAAQNLPEAAKKLEECMASNQQAMKRNAQDADPKFNYEQAKRLWKEILDKMKEQQKNQEQKQQEQQKNEGEKKEGEQKEKQSQKNEQKKEEQAKAQEQKQEEKKEEQGQKEKETKEEQQAQQQETKVGEMSKDDALRLLSTLPQENRESLKEALKHQYQGRTAPDKDW
jgi:Ca-activated chloride channel family protein